MKKLISVLIACFLAVSASAATIYVDANGTGDYPTIQAAINGANDSDEIVLLPGIYIGSGNRDIDYKGKAITVRSTDVDDPNIVAMTVIDCGIKGRGFYFHSGEGPDSVLSGLTITDGYATEGGGIYCRQSSPTITNCIFSANPALRFGGGLYNGYSSPTLTNCTFSGNWAKQDGGGVYNYQSSPTLTDCTFSDNSAKWDCGGMYNYQSSPTLTNCTFSGNSAYGIGGGMWNYESSPTLANCTFSDNWAQDFGGGMFNYDSSSPTLTNCIFSDNSAYYGSGIFNYYNCSPTLTNCTFSNNWAQGYGGGMLSYDNSSPTLTNCIFSGNSAQDQGGGMWNYESSLTLTNCTFSGNSAQWGGGGMSNDNSNTTTLVNCTFSGNLAGWEGGGMCNYGSSPTLTNCMFSGNSAEVCGGGMWNEENCNPTLTNCTLSANYAGDNGGGMSNFDDSSATLTNCILWGNTAPTGPQIYNDGTSSATFTYSCVQGYVEPNEPAIQGLISCWQFDEGSGSIAYDSVGENYGTLENGPIWTTGKVGDALEFDGTDDYVNCGNDVSLDFTNEITVSAWIYPRDVDDEVVLLSKGDDGCGNYNLFIKSGELALLSGHSCSWANTGINSRIVANRWQHIAVIFDGFDIAYYINGYLKDIINLDGIGGTNNHDLKIGGPTIPGWSLTRYFNGIIDEVRIYDRALSTEEIEQLYQYGLGNIGADPCFVAPGYWDANGTPDDTDDDFWVEGDYHLSVQSLCINAGDPCYVPEPNETDLDGRPRVIGGRIDMGAYEFNRRPVAVAGPNQIAYAGIDGLADVNLDGSGSYDDDNDVLDYYWFWTIDDNDYEANGVSPIISLPVGEHTIELVVDDGIDESEPNYCTIEVIAPLQTRLFCIPYTLHQKTCYRGRGKLLALISMPPGIHKADIDLTEPLVFYPGQTESQYQSAFEYGWCWYRRTYVWAWFDKSSCAEYLEPGFNRVDVVGRLTSGRYYDAAGYLRLVPWRWRH